MPHAVLLREAPLSSMGFCNRHRSEHGLASVKVVLRGRRQYASDMRPLEELLKELRVESAEEVSILGGHSDLGALSGVAHPE